MEYLNEHDFKNNQFNDTILFESDNESDEFDEFEHHISQYENLKEEEEELNDSLMEHDGNREEAANEEEDSAHQISLATSFCKNTQEQSENFLEDKFSGDQLLDEFSEDKFIKCKFSEDFFYERQCLNANNKQQLINESEGDQCQSECFTEQERPLEERSSEDERIVARRKRHFLDFILTLPKVCTPSVCGTMSQQLISDNTIQSNFKEAEEIEHHLGRLTEANEEILFGDEDEEREFNLTSTQKEQLNDYEEHKFDWSIDQLATLKPVDISFNERRFLRYKDFELDQLTQEKLCKENEIFFSQETIAPSPTKRNFQDIGQNDSKIMEDSESMIDDEKKFCKKVNDKDSGNCTDEDNHLEAVVTRDQQLDEFEMSFIEHSSNRLSNIEFDFEFKMNRQQIDDTPMNQRKSFILPLNSFKPNSMLQTSTPCTSLFKLKEFNKAYHQANYSTSNQTQELNSDEIDFTQPPKQSETNLKLPLQERSSIKQKKRLFYNLSSSNDKSSLSSSCASSLNLITNLNASKALQANEDEGICESSKEVTFGSSNESSLMSVCDNNSLTPKPKKTRNSVVKSFAKRLDEIELINDENRSNSLNANSSNSTADCQNSTSKWHNLTDSNCFMIKNFNNFNFNNSDSGCYANGSNSLVDSKRKILF